MTTNVTVQQYFIDSGWVWWGGEGKLIISRSAFLSQLAERDVSCGTDFCIDHKYTKIKNTNTHIQSLRDTRVHKSDTQKYKYTHSHSYRDRQDVMSVVVDSQQIVTVALVHARHLAPN